MYPSTAYAPARKAQVDLCHVNVGGTATLSIGGVVKVIKHDHRAGLTVVEGANGRTLRLPTTTRVEPGGGEMPRAAQLADYERALQAIAAASADDLEGVVRVARKALSKYGAANDGQ